MKKSRRNTVVNIVITKREEGLEERMIIMLILWQMKMSRIEK
jgi:hypothetical protein